MLIFTWLQPAPHARRPAGPLSAAEAGDSAGSAAFYVNVAAVNI